MERNGRTSNGKRTHHINIRYFLIQVRVENDEIILIYCPTDDMIGYCFTNPLQRMKFYKFRYIIMRIVMVPNVVE